MSHNPADDGAQLREELVSYLDGELDAEQSRRIEERAAVEPDARRMLEELDRTWHMLDALDAPVTSEDFTRTTLEMVALAAAEDVQKAKVEAPRRRLRARLWAVAGLIAATAAGFFVVASLIPDPNAQLLQDLPILENFDQYHEIDSFVFLRELTRARLFADDVLPAVSPAAMETFSQRRRQVEAMPAEQRDYLLRSEQQFRALPAQEQQRIRDLHDQIENAPDREKLRATMNRYCKWFETQPPFRRAKLRDKTYKRAVTVKAGESVQVTLKPGEPVQVGGAKYPWDEKDMAQRGSQRSRTTWQSKRLPRTSTSTTAVAGPWPSGWTITPRSTASRAWARDPMGEARSFCSSGSNSPSFLPTGKQRSFVSFFCGVGRWVVPTASCPSPTMRWSVSAPDFRPICARNWKRRNPPNRPGSSASGCVTRPPRNSTNNWSIFSRIRSAMTSAID